jgi:uncharacterized protein
MESEIQVIQDLKTKLRLELGERIKDVILFGSRSKGMAEEYSDYDVLIILELKPDWTQKRKISEICYEIELQYNILIDSHLISQPELNTLRGKQPIFQRAIRKGIYV